MKEFIKKVSKIQTTLKAPKNQRNTFGNYNYRSCEDILEAVKPLLEAEGLVLTINDDIVEVGGRIYVKSTSKLTDGVNEITNTAWAREADEQKGMNVAQITGSSSSYAKKYSLNGLFLIDDTKDADATNTHGKDQLTASKVQTTSPVPPKTTSANAIKAAADNQKPIASFKRPVKPTTVSTTSNDGDL